MYSRILLAMCLSLLCFVSGDQVEVFMAESPVKAEIGGNLTLTCTMPGFAIHVQPMFARWQKRSTSKILAQIHQLANQLKGSPLQFWYFLTYLLQLTNQLPGSPFPFWGVQAGGADDSFDTISQDLTVISNYHGYSRASVRLMPGDYTTWYQLTITDFHSEDAGVYKCVATGPTEEAVVASGTVEVIL